MYHNPYEVRRRTRILEPCEHRLQCIEIKKDAFGLAVLIFQLFFMGRHPFSGRFAGSQNMPLERAISECRFAYSSRRSETRMDPPPNVPLLSDVPPYIASAFEKAFGKQAMVGGRPSAAEWVALLQKAETEIVVCSANDAHHYFKVASSCPWCRMEQAAPGFIAFTPRLSAILGPTVRGAPDSGVSLA